ncbi:hypothetical protein EZV73_13975 [Acidaminobacter sp. JC074]|uniref:hypothetical protein n=1 Tax=Acidaminobacter sp. JC074 TaxID=2530199 RepID=UPI001F0DCA12|nr:hypothetical protein [Acidaminobacter sp. JC074]MCH4888697.1 hypothetical protein [Acidaminobacter sp. JC074]
MFDNLDVKKYLKTHSILIFFFVMVIIGFLLTDKNLGFLVKDMSNLLIMTLLLSLALIMPIKAGMGFNFAIITGCIAGQLGLIFAINAELTGMGLMIVTLLMTCLFTLLLGLLNGFILSKADDHTMIASYFLGTASGIFYSFIVFGLLGTIIRVSPDLLFPDDQNIRSTLDIKNLFPGNYVLIMLVFAIAVMAIIHFTEKSNRLDQFISSKSTTYIKTSAFTLSIFIAALGQIFYLMNSKYIIISYPNTGLWSMGALSIIIGGGTYKKANLSHVLIGSILIVVYRVVTIPALTAFFSNQVINVIGNLITSLVLLSVFIHKDTSKNRLVEKETS